MEWLPIKSFLPELLLLQKTLLVWKLQTKFSAEQYTTSGIEKKI
jgi:hypothetical protein